ncbi:MAG TPA: four helix bundle protein [Armatimonadota bacterium]|nr:four helix bundle protein [Armatimonadota bacterium]
MAVVSRFTELRVYQHSFDLAMRIYSLSKRWAAEERFSLTDQIRRSSRSVCGCVAEAWKKRQYPNHFMSKLIDADAEVAETQNWLKFAAACGYLTAEDLEALWQQYEEVSGGLAIMMAQSDKWCGYGKSIHEPDADYSISPT